MTIVSHSRRFVFVRPYKVASSSIMVCLARACTDDDVVFDVPMVNSEFDADARGDVTCQNAIFDDWSGHPRPHPPAAVVRKIVGTAVWDDYFKFSVVRNPWDWLVSLYWWRLHIWREHVMRPPSLRARLFNPRRRWRLMQVRRSEIKRNLERVLRRGWFEPVLERWPKFYLVDESPCLDFYIRFEHLQTDYDVLCRRLELPIGPLPRTKYWSRPKSLLHYRDCYTTWSRDYVARRYARLIEIFDYRF